MIEETLTAMLRAVTPNVHAEIAPFNALEPYVVFSRVSTQQIVDMDGPIGVSNSTFHVDVFEAGFLKVRQLATRVRDALSGVTTPTLVIRLEQETDLSDLADGAKTYRVNLQFRITHDE